MLELERAIATTNPLQRKITFVQARLQSSGISVPTKYTPINASFFNEKSDNGASQSTTPIPRPPILRVSPYWKRAFGPGVGLSNLGNTCFANSALQCILHTAPLVNLMEESHGKNCKACGFCIYCAMEKLFAECSSGRESKKIVQPRFIMRHLKQISPTFSLGRQGDAHEFLRFIISGLQDKEAGGKAHHSVANSDIFSIFGGYLRSEVHCLKCNYKSRIYDEFMDLSLEIASNELQKCLSHFTEPEILEKSNAYACPCCKTKTKAKKQFTIQSPPAVLAIHFKRFGMLSMYWDKNNKKIQYPEVLDLGPYLSESVGSSSDPHKSPRVTGETKNSKKMNYRLYGVLVHQGHSMHSGHYYSIVKASNQKWYIMNDDSVYYGDINKALNLQAYVLFYIRDDLEPKTEDNNNNNNGHNPVAPTPAPTMNGKEIKSQNPRKRKMSETDFKFTSEFEEPNKKKNKIGKQ